METKDREVEKKQTQGEVFFPRFTHLERVIQESRDSRRRLQVAGERCLSVCVTERERETARVSRVRSEQERQQAMSEQIRGGNRGKEDEETVKESERGGGVSCVHVCRSDRSLASVLACMRLLLLLL